MGMTHALLTDDAQAAIERIGAADLVVGIATVGTSPALAAVAEAVRTGLDAHFPGQAVAIVHVDHGPSDDPATLLGRTLGQRPVVRVRASHHDGETDGGPP